LRTVVVKSVDEDGVRRAADAWATRLLEARPEVEEVVFFGSFARGTFAPGSDLDVLIIVDRSAKAARDRIPDYLPGAFPVGVDLFVMTREEVAREAAVGLLTEVRRSGWRHLRAGRDSALPPRE
jgi:predicted nucleotidyltransferase